jgi:serine protease AprX
MQRKIWISDERIARFSSRGPVGRGIPKPDILAPGVSIISLRAPGSWLDRTMKGARVGKWYFTLSGTSMSTPMVAGAVSQLLQKFPRLTPNQVKGILKKHAISLNLNVNTQGSGLLNMRFLAKPTYRP